MDTRRLKRLVLRARKGDGDAAAEIFDLYHSRIYRYALAKLRHPVEAEDVAAETFAKVLKELKGFRWRGAGFEAWLFRIASNVVVDHVRRSNRQEQLEEATTIFVRWADGPERDVLRAETAGELRALLNELCDEQKEVLLLRFAAGLSSDEVAKVMRKKPNAIRQLQFRALSNLRQQMALKEAAS